MSSRESGIRWTDEEIERLSLWLKSEHIESLSAEVLRKLEQACLDRSRWRWADSAKVLHLGNVSKGLLTKLRQHQPNLKMGYALEPEERLLGAGPSKIHWSSKERGLVARHLKKTGRTIFIRDDLISAEQAVLTEARWRFTPRRNTPGSFGVPSSLGFALRDDIERAIPRVRWVKTYSAEGREIMKTYHPEPAPEPPIVPPVSSNGTNGVYHPSPAPEAEVAPEPEAPAPVIIPPVTVEHSDTVSVSCLLEIKVPAGLAMTGLAEAMQRLANVIEATGGIRITAAAPGASPAPPAQSVGSPVPVPPVATPAPVPAKPTLPPEPKAKLPDLKGFHLLYCAHNPHSCAHIRDHKLVKDIQACGGKVTVLRGDDIGDISHYTLNPTVNRVVVQQGVHPAVWKAIITTIDQKFRQQAQGVTGGLKHIEAFVADYPDSVHYFTPPHVPPPFKPPTLGDVLADAARRTGTTFASTH